MASPSPPLFPTLRTVWELPLMTSTKFLEFLPAPPCPHLERIYYTKFSQPPLLRLLFHDPPSPLRCGHHMWRLPLRTLAQTINKCQNLRGPLPPYGLGLRRIALPALRTGSGDSHGSFRWEASGFLFKLARESTGLLKKCGK